MEMILNFEYGIIRKIVLSMKEHLYFEYEFELKIVSKLHAFLPKFLVLPLKMFFET